MAVTKIEFSCPKAFSGILAVFFPGYRIYVDYLPPFPPGDKIILLSDRAVKDSAPFDIIQIAQSGKRSLADRVSAIDFVGIKFGQIPERYRQYLMRLENDEFWKEIKLFSVLKKPTITEKDMDDSIFFLFKDLFGDFNTSYSHYLKIGKNPRFVLQSLCTMMLKAKNPDASNYNPGYKLTLKHNQQHIGRFKNAILNLGLTLMEEPDFIIFLRNCSVQGN